MTSLLFVFRLAFAWFVTMVIIVATFSSIAPRAPRWMFPTMLAATLLFAIVRAFSHMRRVRLIADRVDGAALGNRHRRQIEMPFAADEAFAMVEAAIRELPYVDSVESAGDSLQVRARVRRMSPYLRSKPLLHDPLQEHVPLPNALAPRKTPDTCRASTHGYT